METTNNNNNTVNEQLTLRSKLNLNTTPPVACRVKFGTPEYTGITRAMTLGGFSTFALLYGLQPLMPAFSSEFQVSAATASGVVSASTGAMALALIPASLLADKLGRRPVMIASVIFSALFTLMCAAVSDFSHLLVLRALLGILLAGLPAVAIAYLSEEIEPDVLGRAIGLYISGNALGAMFGRFLSALVADAWSWRVAVVLLGLVAFGAAMEFCRCLPASRNFKPSGFSVRKVIDAAGEHLRDGGLPWLFIIGYILMGCFVSVFNYLTYRLAAEPYHFSQSKISIIYSLNAAGIFASTWVGTLADKMGRRNVLWIMVASMLIGLLVTLSGYVPLIYIGTALFSFGFFGGHSVASSWLGFRAVHNKALATALYLSIYYLGSSSLGTLTGFMWGVARWNGVVLLLAGLLCVGLFIALKLRGLMPRTAN